MRWIPRCNQDLIREILIARMHPNPCNRCKPLSDWETTIAPTPGASCNQKEHSRRNL